MSKLELSFEFFPPKTAETEEKTWEAIERLALLNPLFVSVTYGAGGGIASRNQTHQIAKDIITKNKLKTAAHLTCVGSTRDEINELAKRHWDGGIRHIVALRGDPPKGTPKYIPHKDGYAYATDLMRGLRIIGDFEISVAAFPEKHPESASFEQDIEILKAKEDIGAARAITQYFFDDEFYLRLRDRAYKANIRMPIVPGIIPINHFAHIKKFSAMCGTSIPATVAETFEKLDEEGRQHERDMAAIELATAQCKGLLKEGINKFHFYTMNRPDLITAICCNIGLTIK